MQSRCTRIVFAAFVLALIGAQPVAAQYWPERERPYRPDWRAPRDYGEPRYGPRQVVCAPSGFARLGRNCNANVGGCQRMPESCSYGWCCP
jgi:hypothetical protein